MSTSKTVAGSSITIVAIRLPTLWRKNTAAWFRQLETQFALVGVTMDASRFNHALLGLDEDCSYKRLNGQLIERVSVSETDNHLLAELTHNDNALSQLTAK